ncbi:TetR/AcrR family transcriptional regulator [Nocardioides sp. NPDC000445]|uniref:TetR/AcrR family transcriptional regulator n=1 Tax=Nocardioides sp. NPDC000445 TaxID=3154257 RepID=UPI00332558E0
MTARPTRGRGQHAGLSTHAILRSAIRLADREGLGALSMRRLGTELGVEAMALYHHFPSKDALLDAVVGELVTEATAAQPPGDDWQAALRGYGLAFHASLTAHPQLVPLVLTRPAVTSGNLRVVESLVGSISAAGFAPERALDMVYAVGRLAFVHAALSTGTDEATFVRGDPTDRLGAISPEDYPHLAAAAQASIGRPLTYRLEFALDALIAGFAQLQHRP